VKGSCQLPPDVKVAGYRIVQEALNNVAKHAQAELCTIFVNCLPDGITIEISDDGKGFDYKKITPEHLGLGIMEDRAKQINADFDIRSTKGKGTIVKMKWLKSRGESNE
jgi:signal transduction histidine kinase